MTRFRNDLFPGVFFALVLLGLPGGLLTEAADAASEPPAIAAADVRTPSNEQDVLKTVLETRDEVRALRREVDSLRRMLESTAGKNESNSPPKPDAGGIIGRSRPPIANGVCFFDAQWCGPCRQMRPLVEQLKREGLPIVVVDVDQCADLKRDFDIEKLPTFVLLIRERETERVTGLHSEAQLRALLAKVPKADVTSKASKSASQAVSSAKRESGTLVASGAAAQPAATTLQGPPSVRKVPTATNGDALVAQKVIWRYFAGNKSVSGERLAMELRSSPAFDSILGKFDPANLAKDVVAVRAYYEKLGFFDAKITPTLDSSKDRKWLYVCYRVQEGQQYRIHKLGMTGNTRFKTDELLGAIKTREGQFYNGFTIKEDLEAIKKKYDRTPFRSMKLEVVPHFLEQPAAIDLVMRIDEGKPYETRVYPVADLVVPVLGGPRTNVRDNFGKLIGLLTDSVEPKSWENAGGAGSITCYEKTMSLVIRQTEPVHRQVMACLRSLRSLHDWQVCLELTLVKNPPADVLQSLSASAPAGSQSAFGITEEQKTELLAAAQRDPNSKVLLVKATMFYGTHGAVDFGGKEDPKIDVGIDDSTDRYASSLRFGLRDKKTGTATAEPVTVNVSNSKTVVIQFKPIGGEASGKPSLLVVRPRLFFPFEEEEQLKR